MPVWMALRAQMVGRDSGYAREKRRLSLARASMLGVFIHSLPYAPTWSFLRLSMITTTTLVSDFSRWGPHPEESAEAPSRAAPVPASFRKSFRVSALCNRTFHSSGDELRLFAVHSRRASTSVACLLPLSWAGAG